MIKGPTYIPEDREGWWGKPDKRLRCRKHHKVVFTETQAERSAQKATNRGTPMHAYLGNCGHWHTARTRERHLRHRK